MKSSSLLLFTFTLLPILVLAQSPYEGSTNVQLLYGENFEPNDEDLATLTPQHTGSAGIFEHYGFIDIYFETNREDFSAYLEWYPKISLSGTSNRSIGAGLLTDILIGGGINTSIVEGENSWVWLAGPVWQFSLPRVDFFQLETYYYQQLEYQGVTYDGTYQITPAWDIHLPVTDQLRFRLEGFIDFIGDRGPGEHQIITQPQLLLDVGNFWDMPGRMYIGTEYRYWYNKGGEEDITESVFQGELRLEL